MRLAQRHLENATLPCQGKCVTACSYRSTAYVNPCWKISICMYGVGNISCPVHIFGAHWEKTQDQIGDCPCYTVVRSSALVKAPKHQQMSVAKAAPRQRGAAPPPKGSSKCTGWNASSFKVRTYDLSTAFDNGDNSCFTPLIEWLLMGVDGGRWPPTFPHLSIFSKYWMDYGRKTRAGGRTAQRVGLRRYKKTFLFALYVNRGHFAIHSILNYTEVEQEGQVSLRGVQLNTCAPGKSALRPNSGRQRRVVLIDQWGKKENSLQLLWAHVVLLQKSKKKTPTLLSLNSARQRSARSHVTEALRLFSLWVTH